jgi:thiol-disulfide isomerase/thioredoxin
MKKILKISSDFCKPCKSLSKTFDSIKHQFPYEIEEINIDHEPDFYYKKYNLIGVPTLIITRNDIEVRRYVGDMTKNEIESFVIDL